MPEINELAKKLDALGHPLRIRIIATLATRNEEMYLNEIANTIGVSRALAKIVPFGAKITVPGWEGAVPIVELGIKNEGLIMGGLNLVQPAHRIKILPPALAGIHPAGRQP